MYTILIADDNKKICDGLIMIISQCFPELKILGPFYNGEDAISEIKKSVPDIVISDIRMPKADGLEICRLIRSKSSLTKIILVTGYQEFEYAKKAIEYNTSALLVKPYSSDQLIETVKASLKELDTQIQNAKDSTYVYLSKWNESRRKIFALTSGAAEQDYLKIRVLCNTTPLNECLVSEINFSDLNIKDAFSLEFDSPNLSVFCLKDRLVLFFKKSCYKNSYLNECGNNGYINLNPEEITEQEFSKWYERICVKALAESMAEAFRESNVDSFIENKKYIISKITDLQPLFDETAEILGYQNRENKTDSKNIPAEERILQFFNAYLSSSSVLSIQIKRFIENNYKNPDLSINDIADHFLLTNNYIGECFKNQTGISIREYINQIRIEAAKEYIIKRPFTNNDNVSKLVGYNSPSYFHRIFKKLVHMTPTQFKKNQKNL